MHNLLSRSQLDEWRHFEDTLDDLSLEEQNLNDYYECLIECDSLNQSQCKNAGGCYCKPNARGVDPLFFCVIIQSGCPYKYMDRENLKLVVKNLKSLVNALESEVYSDVDAYKKPVGNPEFGFYEGSDDDDGYAD